MYFPLHYSYFPCPTKIKRIWTLSSEQGRKVFPTTVVSLLMGSAENAHELDNDQNKRKKPTEKPVSEQPGKTFKKVRGYFLDGKSNT